MRLVLWTILPALLITTVAPAWADEPEAADQTAARIGRDLISKDAVQRRAAEAQLLERIGRGGDLGPFLRSLSDAASSWANNTDRLMEVWLESAVHGTAKERERSARLLHALGVSAIERLALELRHARQHGAPAEAAEAPATPPSAAAAPPPQQAEMPPLEPRTPRIYDVRDLIDKHLNPLEMRSLLQKAADASEVVRYGKQYVVTATEEGHAALYARLQVVRKEAAKSSAGQEDAQPAPQQEPQAPGAKEGDAEPAEKPGPPQPGAKAADNERGVQAALDKKPRGPGWRLAPVIFHVPDVAALSLVGTESVGSVDDARRWDLLARRLPEAKAQTPEPFVVHAGIPGHVFLGRTMRYSRDVTRAKGGAWQIVRDTVRHGLDLHFLVSSTPKALWVDVDARSLQVQLPIPAISVRPAKNAAPVELDAPEWTVTTSKARFELPRAGGGARVTLDGLAQDGEDRVVLVLSVEPVLPMPQVAAQREPK